MTRKTVDSTAQLKRAKSIVYRLLKIRIRSEKEIRDRLKVKQFPSSIINQTVQFFNANDLIDDRYFTKQWISYRQSKPYGLNRIRFELIAKGISEDILSDELAKGFANYPEEKIVEELIERRWEKYQNLDPLKRRTRIYQYLQRRGFSPTIIQKMIRNYENKRNS